MTTRRADRDRTYHQRPIVGEEDGVLFLPIIHYSMEFAELVRQAFELESPDAVAVEYLPSLKKPILKAVQRLPALSVILYVTCSEKG